MLTRRELLRSTAAGAAALAIPATPRLRAADPAGFTLPPLPYAFDALEPHIDAKTMEIHHDKHHAAYVANLNKALAGHPDWLKKPIVEVVRDYKKLPAELQTPVRNNGGGHLNHTWFWQMMAKKSDAPKGELAKAIDATYGNLDGFKKEFAAAAASQFGSGWAWLVKGKGPGARPLSPGRQRRPARPPRPSAELAAGAGGSGGRRRGSPRRPRPRRRPSRTGRGR